MISVQHYYNNRILDFPGWAIVGEGFWGPLDLNLPDHIYATEWPNYALAFRTGSLAMAPALWGKASGVFGHTRAKAISGVTYDQTETPIASATVRAFVTSTKKYENEAVSDSSGVYAVVVPYDDTEYFMRAHKDGSPNVAGTTDDNITGA